MKEQTVRLVVADRYPIFAQAVQRSFEDVPGFKVVAVCEDGDATLHAVTLYRPEIAIVDIELRGTDALAVLQRVEAMPVPTRVVLIADDLCSSLAVSALRSNVDGIVSKRLRSDTLVECVRKVSAGIQWIDPGVLRSVVDRFIVQAPDRTASTGLTAAEDRIVRLIADGLVNKEIADVLGISEGTVKNHLHNVYVKLGLNGRREVARHAREAGLLTRPS